MKILLSCVGDTDPIRFSHDGAILHIARYERPDKILLVHSERTVQKHDYICKAIESIAADYQPDIESYKEVIPNEDVYKFDVIFELIERLLADVLTRDDEYILNLSSGTPQIKSALFTINRISNFQFRAYQVASPKRDSNRVDENKVEEQYSEDEAIEKNKDNCLDTENRLELDSGINFMHSLVKKSLRELIGNYDYHAALSVVQQHPNLPHQSKLEMELSSMVESFHFQKVPENLKVLDRKSKVQEAATAFFACTMMMVKYLRGDIAEAIIRAQSISEFLARKYIQKEYPGLLIKKKQIYFIDQQYARKIPNYKIIIDRYEELTRNMNLNGPFGFHHYNSLLRAAGHEKLLEPILEIKKYRNKVAHDLHEVTLDISTVPAVMECITSLFYLVYFDDNESFSIMDYLQAFNKKLLKMLE
ncbi:type III-A CRISPR-associated CARF protein Csm6 [Tuanshanicoccus lijuaniae]|uniref:type III-A CRISPR-associated CARF protein Csm6 n=1 Tax=Aerococcaceae bacterium zg-1292 TaxID=2774330 RepID=UPI001BD807A9|nr:hypothetical protein [Aerococcaceae bacterium zg-A91]MBS4458500.1 hypothetical protein [Aerococcaceae bacterium zg-BR33]